MHSPLPNLDGLAPSTIAPFRRRIRLLRVWRCAAIGGAIGAAGAILMIVADYQALIALPQWAPLLAVVLGIAGGIARALSEPLPAQVVAKSVDRRANLADRLTSAAEVSTDAGPLAPALHEDANQQAQRLDPRALYPLRFSRPHAALALTLLVAIAVYLAFDTTLFKSAQAKIDAAKERAAATQIEHIAKPFLDQAQQPGATKQEQELAEELRRFTADLNKGRLTREQALVRANQLAEEAKRLMAPRSLALAQR